MKPAKRGAIQVDSAELPTCLLSPVSGKRLLWDFLQLLLLAYITVMLPMRIGFELTPSHSVTIFEYLVDFVSGPLFSAVWLCLC